MEPAEMMFAGAPMSFSKQAVVFCKNGPKTFISPVVSRRGLVLPRRALAFAGRAVVQAWQQRFFASFL